MMADAEGSRSGWTEPRRWDGQVALTVPERLAGEVAFLLRVGRNEVSVDPEVETLVDAWCENVSSVRTER